MVRLDDPVRCALVGLGLLPLLTGCGKKINADEAGVVLDAAWLVSADGQQQIEAATEEGVDGLTVTESGGGHEVNGVLGQGSGWSGRLLVDAYVEREGDSGLWDLELGLSGVNVGPNTLDGDLVVTVDKEASEQTAAFTQSYAIAGTLTVEGEARGEADVAVTFSLSADAGGVVTCSVSGDVDGHEVISCAGQTVTVVEEGEGDSGGA